MVDPIKVVQRIKEANSILKDLASDAENFTIVLETGKVSHLET